MKQVQRNLKTAQDRQKSHANLKRTLKEFRVGEHVFVKVKPTKISFELGKCAKLTPRYGIHSKYWQEWGEWHIS